MGTPRPPPLRRGGLFRFGTTEAPSAEARGPPSLRDHRGPRRWGEGASLALGPPGPPPLGRGGLFGFRTPMPPPLRRGGLLRCGITKTPPLRRRGLLRFGFTEAGVCVSPPQTCGTADWGDTTGGLEDGPAHGHLRQKCRAPGEGGDRATDQAPVIRRPNAAQSVVPGG